MTGKGPAAHRATTEVEPRHSAMTGLQESRKSEVVDTEGGVVLRTTAQPSSTQETDETPMPPSKELQPQQ